VGITPNMAHISEKPVLFLSLQYIYTNSLLFI